MTTETGNGLVLRTYPLTETSLIVHWLTAQHGRIATVAKGARRPKSLFHGRLDLFYEAEFSFQRNRRSELHNLREVRVENTHPALRRELGYLQQASYFAALVNTFTEIETPLPEIYQLLDGTLGFLPARPPDVCTVFAFEIKLMSELGVEPNLADSGLTEPAQRSLRALQASDWSTIMATKLENPVIGELKIFLRRFLAFQLGKIPKGRESALECC